MVCEIAIELAVLTRPNEGRPLPRRMWAMPFLFDQHCHIPPAGAASKESLIAAARRARPGILRQTFVGRARDMGVAALAPWEGKPEWIATALRGLTGQTASVHARRFADAVRAGGEAGEAVRENSARGASLVKVIATGSGLDADSDAVRPVIDRAAFAEVAAMAQRLELPVAVHCHGGVVVEWAVAAGVSTIEHGLYLRKGDLDLLRAASTQLTVTPGAYLSAAPKTMGPLLMSLLRTALDGGVRLGVGTDGEGQTMVDQLRALTELGVPFVRALELCAGEPLGDLCTEARSLVLFERDPARDIRVLLDPIAVLDREGDIGIPCAQ